MRKSAGRLRVIWMNDVRSPAFNEWVQRVTGSQQTVAIETIRAVLPLAAAIHAISDRICASCFAHRIALTTTRRRQPSPSPHAFPSPGYTEPAQDATP